MTTTGETEIVSADLTDAAAISKLVRSAYTPWKKELGYLPMPAEADHKLYINRGLSWVMRSKGGTILGVLEMEEDPETWTIFNICVVSGLQGRGYGRKLLSFAEILGRQRGFSTIRLYTGELMVRNIELYQKLGYKEVGRRPNEKRPGKIIVEMEKAL